MQPINKTRAVPSYFRGNRRYGRTTTLVCVETDRVLFEVMGDATRAQAYAAYVKAQGETIPAPPAGFQPTTTPRDLDRNAGPIPAWTPDTTRQAWEARRAAEGKAAPGLATFTL